MPALTTFGWLFTAWGVVTGILVLLLVIRGLISMKEDDQLFLDPAEHQLEEEQKDIACKLRRLYPYIRGLAVVSAILFLAMAGMVAYQVVKVYLS